MWVCMRSGVTTCFKFGCDFHLGEAISWENRESLAKPGVCLGGGAASVLTGCAAVQEPGNSEGLAFGIPTRLSAAIAPVHTRM